MLRNPISRNARSHTIPPTASRNRSTAYVNGRNGLIAWKNSGSDTTGYVPPEPAICRTSKTMASALPTSPNTDTSEYTISINTTMINKPNNTNQTDDDSITPTINISHKVSKN